jgi:hypothetical protein
MAKQDHMSGVQPTEPTEGIPLAFKVGAVLLFVVLIVIAVLLTPAIPIPD